MTTPAKPRFSAIPGPGRGTGIPTPGRSRSASNVNVHAAPTPGDEISRAFADAIKANDPSQHRTLSQSTSISSSSLSPQTISASGRRSVVGRPSSSTSISSNGSSVRLTDRAKTPARISRPPSRQSDVATRPPRNFEVGDNVRIESLGFEGKLRYIGEIDGKPGLWAGVELSKGFAGKGKNNGTVAGRSYFSCPENCGVFVATTKLSPPTVGAAVIARPPSVASSRGGGRTTPAPSGRATPSFTFSSRTPSASYSNGRVTPSTGGGRATPGLTPGLPTRSFKTPTASKPALPSLADKISAGSRAAKYMSMTAQQLNSRTRSTGSPTRERVDSTSALLSSPSLNRTMSSPTRSSNSPFTTPKAGLGKLQNTGSISPSHPSTRIRPSLSTPRARVPSAVSMPPPPSPQLSAQSSLDGGLDSATRSVPDRTPISTFSSSRPSSAASLRSNDEVTMLEQLQSRLEAVEYENERLRAASELNASSAEKDGLQAEKDKALEQVRTLEKKLLSTEETLASRLGEVETLKSEIMDLSRAVEQLRRDSDAVKTTQQEQMEEQAERRRLAQEELEVQIRQREEFQQAAAQEKECLIGEFENAQLEFESERKYLAAQIDELRVAGQETIALYEERLSAASNDRYELETRISSLEGSLRTMAASHRSEDSASQISSATEIENESLREQVAHLQLRSEKLEEKLEETRAVSEKEIMEYRGELKALRKDDEQRNREFSLKTKEAEKLAKSEASARVRVDEIEEALRESTVALENTRGEVESLRMDLANLDILINDNGKGDITTRVANFIKRLSTERTKYEQELARLRNAEASRSEESKRCDEQLLDKVATLEKEVTNLTLELEAKTNEYETLRKKSNREMVIANGVVDGPKGTPPKSDSVPVKEEVAGLKHIVQELQKENTAATQRIKMLESENQILSLETEQLRQEVRVFEENLDNQLLNAEAEELGTHSQVDDPESLRRKLKDQSTRYELELDQARKRVNEAEMKHTRAIHDLNKEISELEALVEAKIYREDELEQEIEKLKEKIQRHKKSSKSASDTGDGKHRLSTASLMSTVSSETPAADVCEICEQLGHDIFSCGMLKGDSVASTASSVELICEDCESPGHVAADCPHSLDVF